MPKAASKRRSGRARAERLEARVTAEQKDLIERAATLQGRTVTDFVLTSVQEAAKPEAAEISAGAGDASRPPRGGPAPTGKRLRAIFVGRCPLPGRTQ